MNAQNIQHLLHTTKTILERAWTTYRELRLLELQQQEAAFHSSNPQEESEEDRKRRRRLKALRLTLMTISLYVTYRVICRRTFFPRRSRRDQRLQES
jgi:hypothetical protein